MITKAVLLLVASVCAAGIWALTVGFSLPHGFLTPTGPTPVIRPTIVYEVAPTVTSVPSSSVGRVKAKHGSVYHYVMIAHRLHLVP